MPLLANKSPAEVHLMAARSRAELTSRSKDIARAHGDRIRQLTELMNKISASDFQENDTLAGMKDLSVSPDLEQLIMNPTKGL